MLRQSFSHCSFLLWILGVCFLSISAQASTLTLQEVAPGVYMHQGQHLDLDDGYQGDISNIGFIVGKKGVAVVDTGGSKQVGAALLAAIRNITSLPILYVINTHIHPDHIFGNAAFTDEHPVFIGHTKLLNAMALRKDAYLKQGHDLLGTHFSGSEIVPPAQVVTDVQNIDIGDRKLLLTAYPNAHTNTDLTVLDENTQTLWTGDLLFIERTPSLDGDLEGWLTAMNKLEQLQNIHHAIPGHGPTTTNLHQALLNQANYFHVLLHDVRDAIKQGRSMEQAMDSAANSEADHWKLFDVINRRNINLIYPMLEWE